MRGGIPLLLTILVLAGCVAPQTPAADIEAASVAGVDAEGFAPVLFDDVLFQEMDLAVEDGLRLHADVYLPDSPATGSAPTTFPTILLLSPYWGAGTQGAGELGYMPYDFLVQRLLPRGYAVVFGDLAGNGGSSGCWDFMGPVERKAAVAMVEAIAAQEWSDGKVGMMGLSYDGMTQIMAASDAAPHLVTVVPAAPLTSAYKGLIQNGVHYGGGWHATMSVYETSSLQGPGPWNAERFPGWTETLAASPQCLAENHAGDPGTNAYSDYYAARDYQALGSQVKASVFYIQGFRDPAVKPDNYGAWFDGVPTLKKAWLGHWFHQYPTAENAGREDLYLTLHRWFDHTLKGIDNGIDKEPMVDVQDGAGGWRHEDAWPPADITPRALQLSADGSLVESGAESGKVSFGGPTALAPPLVPQRTGAAFGLDVEERTRIAGRPMVNLTLSSDRPAGNVVARLYDGERLVAQGAYNLLYANGLEAPEPLAPMSPVTIGFELYPTDWVLEPGSELKLVLTTGDTVGWYDPDASLASLTLDAGETATLTLPIVERAEDAVFLVSCGKPLKDVVKGCWKDLEDLGVEDDG